MHWGCAKYQKREPVAVQMTIFDFMEVQDGREHQGTD